MSDRPNTVMAISRNTGRHLSPYGIRTVHTPNFERLDRNKNAPQETIIRRVGWAPSTVLDVPEHVDRLLG